MKCRICGATCRCKRAGGGICCSCHSHKATRAAITAHREAGKPLRRPRRFADDAERAMWDELQPAAESQLVIDRHVFDDARE